MNSVNTELRQIGSKALCLRSEMLKAACFLSTKPSPGDIVIK
jgi:hypothetical protein